MKRNKVFLITGGAGFIGSHLTDRLIKKKHKVVVIDNLSTGRKENLNPAFFKKGGASSEAKFYKIDIQSPKISDIFRKEKPEIVFHFAAQINVRKSVANPIEDAKINILGSLNILENCKKARVKKIIFSSTGGAIYGEAALIPTPESYTAFPLSPYGIAKLTIEKYLNYYFKVFGLAFVSLRLANVYGPRQNPKGEAGVVAIFCDKLLKNEQPIIFGDGRQTRNYVFVDDVVDASILAAETNKVGIFNVGTGIETNINKLYQLILKKTGKEIKPIFESTKPGDLKRSCLDCAKIKKQLGWQPRYSLEQGLEKTVKWFKFAGEKKYI